MPAGTDISQGDYWALCSDFNEQMEMLDNHLTQAEAAIRADNDATEAAIKADNTATKQHVDSIGNSLSSRMDTIEARQSAGTAASTDADADYAAEVADARVDGDNVAQPTLGDNIRGIHRLVNGLSDYLAPFTFENVLYVDGTLEIVPGTVFGSKGSRTANEKFDSIRIP